MTLTILLFTTMTSANAQLELAELTEERTPYQILHAEWTAEEKRLKDDFPTLSKVEVSDKKR